MARRRYRRYRRRASRWSPNIQKITDVIAVGGAGEFSGNLTLASNPVQENTTVSQTYTVKNVEFTCTIESDVDSGAEAVTIYIMYVPQGMNVGNNYYQYHPEYIMAYKYLGSPTTSNPADEDQQFQPIKVKSRLARKLQTGDQIILFVNGTSQSGASFYLNINGLVRWWTKAN